MPLYAQFVELFLFFVVLEIKLRACAYLVSTLPLNHIPSPNLCLSLTTSVSKEGMWLSAKSMSSFFFFLAETFISISKGRSIHSDSSEFQQSDLWTVPDLESQGAAVDTGGRAQFSLCFFSL
jgi:hypothetical protein